MDFTTVIVRFTGLILFSAGPPSAGPGAHPSTYVLFPVTPSSATHIAQIGVRQDRDIDCDDFSHQICYHNIDNLSIDLGGQGNAKPNAGLPPGSITQAVDRRVARGHFRRDSVPEALFARMILHEGQQDSTCAIATYRYGTQSGVPIANVVRWSYTYPGKANLVVRGNPLRNGTQGIHWNAPRDAQGNVEIFVRYVTRHDIEHEDDTVTLPTEPEALTHYRYFYTLLDPQPAADAAVPVYEPTRGGREAVRCPWAPAMRFRNGLPRTLLPLPPFFTAGTLTCTVGKGDPNGP